MSWSKVSVQPGHVHLLRQSRRCCLCLVRLPIALKRSPQALHSQLPGLLSCLPEQLRLLWFLIPF